MPRPAKPSSKTRAPRKPANSPKPRSRAARDAQADKAIRKFAIDAARFIADSHCTEVLLLDVRGKSDVMDYVLIASGTSDRQIRSVADDVEKLAQEAGLSRIGTSADAAANWVVLDLVEVVVHLFEPATRAHYDLEMLWGDAPQVKWRRSAADKSTKAEGDDE